MNETPAYGTTRAIITPFPRHRPKKPSLFIMSFATPNASRTEKRRFGSTWKMIFTRSAGAAAKTVIAPALRDRALHVDGWFSTNILGNSDGLALDDPKSLASKLGTKGSVLNQILGYPVEDHIIMIHYYRPRGDDKEAWDNIDLTGFMGQKMQLKLNFLCKDSILAAPLAIEIARCLDLAQQRGERRIGGG